MASVEELIIKLSADNSDLKKKLSDSEKGVQNFGGAVSKLGPMIAGAFAIGTVTAFAKAAFIASEQQERANRRLLFSLNNNTAAFASLTAQANKFQSLTGFADDAIQGIQTLAAQSGKTTAEIKKITEATINWASLTGQDLQAAYLQINATLTGTAGRLTRVDADFGNLTNAQLRNGAAIDLINNKYKDFAVNSASNLERLTANWDEFKEAAGSALGEVVNPLLESMNTMMNTIANSEGFWSKMRTFFAFGSGNYKDAVGRIAEVQADAAIRMKKVDDEAAKSEERRKKTLSDLTTETVKQTEAIDQWVAAYEKALMMAQYDVPQIGQFAGVTMGGATGKGITQKAGQRQGWMTKRTAESPLGGAVALTNKQLEDQISIVNGLSQAFSDLAANGEVSMKGLTMIVLGEIRKIIMAHLAEAISGQVSSNSKFGLPGLAMAAIGISAVMGMFSKLPKFQTGGIVGGSSFAGDGITARVNSGEMILNTTQQAQLFAMANGGGGRSMEVYGRIKAGDIYLSNKRGAYLSKRRGS